MTAWELAVAAVNEHKAEQKPQELAELILLLERDRPSTVLEIGCRHGGTFWLWQQLACENAWILGVDEDTSMFEPSDYRGWTGRHFVLRADSHKPETLTRVEDFFGGAKLDLLFIDGDHSVAGVEEDFLMYMPLVRHGGLVVFHDIVRHEAGLSGVEWLWASLNGTKLEFVFPQTSSLWNGGVLPIASCGIGVWRVP